MLRECQPGFAAGSCASRASVFPCVVFHPARVDARRPTRTAMYTASAAFLDALTTAGVSYLFANFGSDHPAMLEALAAAASAGRPVPKVITCPQEMVGLSAAQGFTQVSGR